MAVTIDIEMLFFFLAGFGFHFMLNFLVWAYASVRDEYLFWRESVVHLRTISESLAQRSAEPKGLRHRLERFGQSLGDQIFNVLENKYIFKMLMWLIASYATFRPTNDNFPAPLNPGRRRSSRPSPVRFDDDDDDAADTENENTTRPTGPIPDHDPNVTPDGSHPDVAYFVASDDQ